MEKQAIEHLSKDERLHQVILKTTVTNYISQGDIYFDLIRSIVSQQLSGKAAKTIHDRFLQLFPDLYPNVDHLLQMDIPALRAVGLSRQKSTYILNVASFFQSEKLFSKNWEELSDEAIVEYLTQIKGVGKWTVEMILMFTLGRPDVLPLDDLMIKKAMVKLYEVEETGRALKPKLTQIAEPWRPYRSLACLYLWSWDQELP